MRVSGVSSEWVSGVSSEWVSGVLVSGVMCGGVV